MNKNKKSDMKILGLIGIILLPVFVLVPLYCIAAVPYGTDLANVYVRPLDGRDTIYDGVGIPPKSWTDQYGGLSERTLIIGNLRQFPIMMNDVDGLKKLAVAQEETIKLLTAQIAALLRPVEAEDPNEAKE